LYRINKKIRIRLYSGRFFNKKDQVTLVGENENVTVKKYFFALYSLPSKGEEREEKKLKQNGDHSFLPG
jgi:hypothetical protein